MTKIAVTGATGRLGRPLVEILEGQGHEVVPIARSKGVDVITGEGLAEALDGVYSIVDAATGPSPDEQEATEFFTTSARNLHAAGAEAGVKRNVLVSIIGIDKFSTGYNVAKDADVPVVLYVERKVKANHAFKTGEMTDKDIEKIVSEVPMILSEK